MYSLIILLSSFYPVTHCLSLLVTIICYQDILTPPSSHAPPSHPGVTTESAMPLLPCSTTCTAQTAHHTQTKPDATTDAWDKERGTIC